MATAGPPRLTLADLEAVMQTLDDHVAEAVDRVPAHQHALISNALLNIAVERILAERGVEPTVSMLRRLAELIADGRHPEQGGPISLTRADA